MLLSLRVSVVTAVRSRGAKPEPVPNLSSNAATQDALRSTEPAGCQMAWPERWTTRLLSRSAYMPTRRESAMRKYQIGLLVKVPLVPVTVSVASLPVAVPVALIVRGGSSTASGPLLK